MPGCSGIRGGVEGGRLCIPVLARGPHMEWVGGADEADVPRRAAAAPGVATVLRLEDPDRSNVRAAGTEVPAEPTAAGAGAERPGEVTSRAAPGGILGVAQVQPGQATVVSAEKVVLLAGARRAIGGAERQQPGRRGGGRVQSRRPAGRGVQP